MCSFCYILSLLAEFVNTQRYFREKNKPENKQKKIKKRQKQKQKKERKGKKDKKIK